MLAPANHYFLHHELCFFLLTARKMLHSAALMLTHVWFKCLWLYSLFFIHQMGAYHTIELELNRKFTLAKKSWDSVVLDRIGKKWLLFAFDWDYNLFVTACYVRTDFPLARQPGITGTHNYLVYLAELHGLWQLYAQLSESQHLFPFTLKVISCI